MSDTSYERLIATLRTAGLNGWEWNLRTKELQIINASGDKSLGLISPLMTAEVATIPHYPEVLFAKGMVTGTAVQMVQEYQQLIYHAEHGQRVCFRIPFTTVEGNKIWLEFTGEVLRDEEGKAARAVGSYRNITKELEAACGSNQEDYLLLQAEKQRYLMLISGLTSEYTNVFFANPKEDTFTAFRLNEQSELISVLNLEQIKSYRELVELYVDKCVYAEDQYLWDCLQNPKELYRRLETLGYFNINYRTFNNDKVSYCQIKVAGRSDSNEIVIGIRDIDDEYRRQQMLERESTSDALTGLLNRRGFERGVKQELASKGHRYIAFLFLDLDHFKNVNDSFGHAKGDEAIQAAAKTLKEVFRSSDYIGRYGGDEFCVFLPDIPLETLRERLDRCLKELTATYTEGETSVQVTTSIGVVHREGDTLIELDRLSSMADKALYEAKEQGRNRYVFAK